MNKVTAVICLLATSLTSTAFAGTGGFYLKSCISSTGRTALTYVATDSQEIVNLIVDGMSVKFENGKNDIDFMPEKNMTMIVGNNGPIITYSTDPAQKGSLFVNVRQGADPRLGTEISDQAKQEGFTAKLSCKTFNLNP